MEGDPFRVATGGCMKIVFALALLVGVGAVQERPRDGVTLPRVVKSVNPEYTQEAKDQRIQGRNASPYTFCSAASSAS
jgi:hypothetical protein